jgi:hypothetical protein
VRAILKLLVRSEESGGLIGVSETLMPPKDDVMRVFALSDIHIDFSANAMWIAKLSLAEYQDDVLILAGDVTDIQKLLDWGLSILTKRFKKVLFVPGKSGFMGETRRS